MKVFEIASFSAAAVILLAAGGWLASGPLGLSARAASTTADDANRTPVVVELFTSEGCSSCPPADAVLSKLQGDSVEGARVIALGMHVDYWNSLGWRDPFSAPIFTQRQGRYAEIMHSSDVYTPQMIVDGAAAFVGSDEGRARNEIAAAARKPKTPLTIKAAYDKDGAVEVSLHLGAAPPAGVKSPVMLVAVTQDGLTSNIRAGENDGLTLTHAAVVRELKNLGPVTASVPAPEPVSVPASPAAGTASGANAIPGADMTTTLKLAADHADPSSLRIAAFVQDGDTGQILAAGIVGWPARN
jgi:hypothetical protein